ncbi:MAG: hemolysin family protein [Candidatus Peregrinibacteria bacterium]|nr:hemolysin family protein [Candidatus Peregrinibacteria bacterium]MDZ4245180.1 hemolysin family protein [Candidatus Gracilibacteria bacterium]
MDLPSILILLILIVLSAFFSASETALTSLTQSKVRELCDKKRKFSHVVAKLKSDPETLLITILIGNNIANILASVFATVVFSRIFESSAIGITTGIMTFLLLVFGEVMPKTFAAKYAVKLSLLVSPVLFVLSKILLPIIWLLKLINKAVEKVAGAQGVVMHASEDELLAMASLGAEEGSIEHSERELIENVLDFDDTYVEQVMTPRVSIDLLPSNATVKEAGQFVLDHTHSRIPVYEDSTDNVIGVVTVKDILLHLQKGEFDKPLKDLDLQQVLQVPETKKINELFKEFQKSHIHIAMVLDEHGGVTGLVTLEDLLEEIVGEIIDEHDEAEDEITKIGNMEWEASGGVEIYDLNKALGVILPSPPHKPLSFFILSRLNRFPRKGERVEVSGFVFIVEEMKGKKIEKISIEKLTG